MKYKVMVDGNRYTYLILSWSADFVETISMSRGIVEVGKIPTDMCVFLTDTDRSPEDLARIYLGTSLDKTPQATRILRSLLGLEAPPEESTNRGRVHRSTNPLATTLSSICDEHGWEASDARRVLRKLGKKPGEHWEWLPEQLAEIVEILKLKLEITKNR